MPQGEELVQHVLDRRGRMSGRIRLVNRSALEFVSVDAVVE